VPQCVETSPNWCTRNLDSRPPYVPECGAANRIPGISDEHEAVFQRRLGGEVSCERVDLYLRQRDGALRRFGLRRSQERRAAADSHELPIDLRDPMQKVDPVHRQAEAFALPHPGPRGEGHERAR
jgi:hypothetical protein